MIYLDNSSTTFKKPNCVKKWSMKGLKKYSINPSRGGYRRAIKTQSLVYDTREKLADFLGTTPQQVIFTSGCTHALNLAILGTAKSGGHIITTIYEHNSVLRVLEKLKHTHKITYTILTPNEYGLITKESIENAIQPKTYMVIINHTSNVTGITQDIKKIGEVCKLHNLIFCVDGAQSIGHEKINMIENNINLLALAGHKGLYAPQGIGALLINDCNVSPIIFGGTGTFSNSLKQPTDYPDGLESGTQNIVGILGLRAGVKYVNKKFIKIQDKIFNLTKLLIDGIKYNKFVTLYSSNYHSGVVSINIKNLDSVELSNLLDSKYNIATRSGLHCAPLVHKYYKTLKRGMTRISISYFNSKKDIIKVVDAINEISIEAQQH